MAAHHSNRISMSPNKPWKPLPHLTSSKPPPTPICCLTAATHWPSKMPQRQVYGKRTASKPCASYANFISPDKQVVGDVTGDDDGLISKKERKPRRVLKDVDTNKVEQKPRKSKVNTDGLVDELKNLKIDESDAAAREVQNHGRIPRRSPRKKTREVAECTLAVTHGAATADHNNASTKQQVETETTALVNDFNALAIGKCDSTRTKTDSRREKSCRTAKQVPTKLCATKSGTTRKTLEQTVDYEHQTERAKPGTSTHTQRLTAVVIPSSKPMSQAPALDLEPELTDPYTSYVAPLLSLQSFKRSIIPFKQWSSTLEPHFTIAKIAEASFSEVYRLSATNMEYTSMKESVLKLVPLRSPPGLAPQRKPPSRAARNPEAQARKEKEHQEEEDSWKSHVDDVYSEVKLLQNLNYIPGFTHFRELTVLQGRPSKTIADAWKSWNKVRPRGRKSEFPDPGKRASYDDTQLWAVIEMQDAGTDVEKVMDQGGLSTIWEIWDVFWGVCLSVAKAEEDCQFEHRDLHLENVCIRSSRSESQEDLLNPIVKDPLRRKLGFTGLETTVIDYTLSRADVSSPTSHDSASPSGNSTKSDCSLHTSGTEAEVAYLDLEKDTALFTGDASEEYQYEIYRYMRGAVFYGDPLKVIHSPTSDVNEIRCSPRKASQHIRFDDLESCSNVTPSIHSMEDVILDPPSDVWRDFHPKTNLVWAHFILYKLLEHLEGNEPTGLSGKELLRNVEVNIEDRSKVGRKAVKLYKVLERVAELLEPSALAKKDSLGSMKELVVLAMEERWLRTSDVSGP